MLTVLLLFLIGVISATFGSLVGLGGGIIIVPALIYLDPVMLHQGITTQSAVGTSLLVLIVTALSSSITFFRQRRIDVRSALLFFIASGPASVLGALMTGVLNPRQFQLWFGCFMLLMAVLMVIRPFLKPVKVNWKIQRSYTDPDGLTTTYGYHLLPALATGFCVGFISGLFGIGGGSLFVPVMILLFSFPPHVATATSMFVIFLSSVAGSITHVVAGEVNWHSALFLAPGAWIGGWLGARIASRLSGGKLLWLLRITLFVLAFRMIWQGLG